MKYFSRELNKSFEDREEMFLEISKNLSEIIEVKKSAYKKADAYGISVEVEGVTKEVIDNLRDITVKSFGQENKAVDYTKEANLPKLEVTVISNATNYYDSHGDVHLDGMWNKTVSDNKEGFDHLQEHNNSFATIISNNCKTKVLKTTFKELGFDFEGNTQALQHKSIIDPIRNLFMYNQYANDWVKNHSVGMQYLNTLYCANTEEDWAKEYKANWDKYYPLIANKDEVDKRGYFFGVKEARLREFSAVPKGSNPITPTLIIETQADKTLQIEAVDPLVATKRRRVI